MNNDPGAQPGRVLLLFAPRNNANPPFNSPQKILQDKEVASMYPCTYKILVHLGEHGFSLERKATVLQVFSEIILKETGTNPSQLLDLAERVNHATQQARGAWEAMMNCDPLDYIDNAGRSLVVYSCGLWSWSYSLDGKPPGRSFMTRSK